MPREIKILQTTTPTIRFILPDTIDLTIPDELIFTVFDAVNNVPTYVYIKKTGDDIVIDETNHNVAEVYLTQEDTQILSKEGGVFVRLQWVYESGRRGWIEKVRIQTEQNEVPEVIT